MRTNCYKLEIFVPRTHFEPVRLALQQADAGHIGLYDSCLSVTEVTGFWRPLPGADPYDGEIGRLCSAPEYKIEVCCLAEKLADTLAAVKTAHPYEEPVINVIALAATGLTKREDLPR